MRPSVSGGESGVDLQCRESAHGRNGDIVILNGTVDLPSLVHFAKGQTSPANAFWSLMMYNSRQFFVANPINRYAIGDRDKLKFNTDGSLDIFIQHDSPDKETESNWLPADAGAFNMIIRIYWPKESVLTGVWEPPPVKKVG